ncbi:hypothetical protein GCM10027019_10310 [Melaminivora jejuensis]|uniref:hypothetical protein n=2 Tax=Melaminivora jejuensis TaxID=1267217 RepID=UPI001E4A5885|nr:hypothetical protein [Melaminivora jejuensis]UHJ64351.1 hypothetical protein LVC68_13485 [Melaminivora jejuensis]
MKTILLAGFSDREAAAIEIMIALRWRERQCVWLKRAAAPALVEQDMRARACVGAVLDLSGLGLAKCTPDNAAQLLDYLAGRPAVLVAGTDSLWPQAALTLRAGQRLHWVLRPYGSAELQAALHDIESTRVESASGATPTTAPLAGSDAPETVGARTLRVGAAADATQARGADGTTAALSAASSKLPAWQRALQLAERLNRERTATAEITAARTASAAPAPAPTSSSASTSAPAPDASTAAVGVASSARPRQSPAHQPPLPGTAQAHQERRDALAQLAAAMPALRQSPFISALIDLLAQGGVHVLHVSPASFVVDMTNGWVASRLPVSALLRLLNTPEAVRSLMVHPLPDDALEQAAQQHLGGRMHAARKPLDLLVWELASQALKGITLQVQADLTLQLLRFPNFTLLEQVGPLDVQLAAICARAPRSLRNLQRSFASHEQEVLRFVVLSVLSDLARVSPAAEAPANMTHNEPAPAAPTARSKSAADAAPERARPSAQRRGFFKSFLEKLF